SSPVCHTFSLFLFLVPRVPSSTLFPYTTLFRSVVSGEEFDVVDRGDVRGIRHRHDQRRAGAVHGDEEVLLAGLSRDELEDLLVRSEEHTSELQSRENLVCRLLLEKKKAETR